MTRPEHQHQLVDADARYPVFSAGRCVLTAPIRCISCNDDQDALTADLRRHGLTVLVEHGRVVADMAGSS